jgi:hypothetical protein
MEPIHFHIIRDGLIVCPHPKGDFVVGELCMADADFVCHVMPGSRVLTYLPLILKAPDLLRACNDLYDLCMNRIDFPQNSIVLIRAKHLMEEARGETNIYAECAGKLNFPDSYPIMPVKTSLP